MFSGPILEIDLNKIRFNCGKVVEKCHQQGIEVLGVTKGFNAIPQIVSAMVKGGVDGLADARLENIYKLRKRGFKQDITLLRIPRLSKASLVAQYADISVNSEMIVIRALAEAGQKMGKAHKVILMVDVGDLREGVMPENVVDTVQRISCLKGVELLGLGTNMGCFGGILPTNDNLGLLIELARDIKKLGIKLEIISGGGTSSLLLVENNAVPPGINQLRIGEGILLGTDTTHKRIIPWLFQDAFLLKAEVIEVKFKPSVPKGSIGRDAFGHIPSFVDRGIRKKAILALGKHDVLIEGIIPVDEHMIVLGASSDHLIVDISDATTKIEVGAEIAFRLTYAGLLSISNSRYVNKTFVEDKRWSSNW